MRDVIIAYRVVSLTRRHRIQYRRTKQSFALGDGFLYGAEPVAIPEGRSLPAIRAGTLDSVVYRSMARSWVPEVCIRDRDESSV